MLLSQDGLQGLSHAFLVSISLIIAFAAQRALPSLLKHPSAQNVSQSYTDFLTYHNVSWRLGLENAFFDFATMLTHPLSKRKAFSLPPINSMLFCQPQKPRHNLLATDTAQHPIISSSCLLGGRGCAFPSGGNVPVKTIFLLAAALSHRQRGLVVQLLIVLAFFFCKWQSFHSTFCDVKMRIGLKHTLGSSPASSSLEGLA